MLSKALLKPLMFNNVEQSVVRAYTCVVERVRKPPIVRKGVDPRARHLTSLNYQYKLCGTPSHNEKWGEVELMLTEYVEGIGHKGEIVSVPRHDAYYSLLPTKRAVYPTEELIELFAESRATLSQKSKVSPYAMKTKEFLDDMLLEIPLNFEAEEEKGKVEWTLNRDHVRIALRYKKVMCPNASIELTQTINSKNYKESGEFFYVNININDYVSTSLKCKIVPVNIGKLWEEFTVFQKTV